MIALLDNGQDLEDCEEEIGCVVGQLLTARTRYRLRDPSRPWAIDNGGFIEFDADAFERHRCRHSEWHMNAMSSFESRVLARAFRLFLPVKWAWDAWRKRRARR